MLGKNKKISGENSLELFEVREYKVVKHNDLIQKSRFSLSLQEQKIILYLISKIKPEDMELKEHLFETADFCRICGIYEDSGANYRYIKNTIKTLADKSAWLMLEDGSESLVRWISKAYIVSKSGQIKIRLDDDLKPYLLRLQKCFTAYELVYTLAMKSQYSVRLYEILKSFEYKRNQVFDIDGLKKRLFAENYEMAGDFKRRVLDMAVNEINAVSDLHVTYLIEKNGRKFARIAFSIEVKKDFKERLESWKNIETILSR